MGKEDEREGGPMSQLGSVAYVWLKPGLRSRSAVFSLFSAMSDVVDPDEPRCKKMKGLVVEADRAQRYMSKTQPGRVQIGKIGFQPHNRGGQGILPRHCHAIAMDICKNCTSVRRYGTVLLVEVPKNVREEWLSAQVRKWKCNFLLARVDTKEMMFATLKNTHFVGAQKLIAEGGRTFHDLPNGMKFILRKDDTEGHAIQKHGVVSTLYDLELWDDESALLALMREDNANSLTNLAESEVDAFGIVNHVLRRMTASTITEDMVMVALRLIGFGQLPTNEWLHIVQFLLPIPKEHATMTVLSITSLQWPC